MFGKEIGFVNLITQPFYGKVKLPGYIFMRGHAVAILMIINKQLLLVKQFRTPIC